MESGYIAKKYEDSIYEKWEKSGAFKAKVNKNKKAFTISMPPPNATGVLHLGHAVMLALEDIMIRHHRMLGEESLWIPGTDHAAIATQSVVEKMLQAKGIKNPRVELGRKKLLKEIHNFAEDSKENIRNQIRKMGASCDWEKEKYTMDEDLNTAVNTLFKYMHEDGLIYRGGRIINWDPKMQTTVSDDEIEHVEEKSKFYYFQFGPVVIGTARPETKFLDKIIVVHPDDKRYKKIIGKEFELEWIDGPIKAKVIGDKHVDMSMGTGAMTITPAHSQVDFEMAQKHKLDSPQIIDFDGIIRTEVSKEFGGMHIEEAREKIVKKLQKKGLVVKIDEEYVHNIAVNYRGKGVIEPQILKQWFVDVNKKVIDWKGKKRSIKEVLQNVVKDKMIEIIPNRFEKTYFHWIDNLRDWCISRQIWWGHQIPMWYKCTEEQKKAFDSKKDASSLVLNILKIDGEIKYGAEQPKGDLWIRDPDTLDTWFSSALWTFSTLGWPKKTKELEFFHPTGVLETGYDILFFWVARMILASTYALRREGLPEEKCIPFKTVYLHGLIRDRHGKKMSKSNPETCIDPLDMIEKYGADALRLSLVIGSTPGSDMRLYEEKIAGYRNFINKIWNSARFALMNVDPKNIEKELKNEDIKTLSDKWILNELQKLIEEVDKDLEKHRFSDAGTKIYEFIWSKYCDWYLECSKGPSKNEAVLIHVLRTCLKLLHPFVPYVTEKIWESINKDKLLINEQWPVVDSDLIFKKEAKEMQKVQDAITNIRSARAELNVESGKKIKAVIYVEKSKAAFEENLEFIKRAARLEELVFVEKQQNQKDSKTILSGKNEIYLPLSNMIDPEKELKRLDKEIEQKQKFINSLGSKLKNVGFTKNAPEEVIKKEEKRLAEESENLEKLLQQRAQIVV